jgi:hypothetical protein
MRLTICARAFVVLFAWTLAAQAGAQVIGTTGQEALETARSGTVFTWRNPDDGTSGSFIPRPAFQDAAGRICRAFDQTVMIGGQMQQAQGTACRQSDGWWELRSAAVDGPPPAPRFVPAPVIVHAPPPIIYDYRPVHYAPVYRYPRPYHHSSIQIRVGPPRHHPHRHHPHRHRRW